ncbi:hypothetical protein GCM10009789_82410 [Kribbella sancticallisti]|uniref:Uncharacterized protein n=1 Tax=Kribbella sancticallisti TaxID=460087 RepID=A0ABP4QS83_9ACTN
MVCEPASTVELLSFIKRAREFAFTLDEVEELVTEGLVILDNCEVIR